MVAPLSNLSHKISALNSHEDDDRITEEEIELDLEDERATVPDLVHEDLEPGNHEFMQTWKKSVFGASKGVTDKTDGEYQRLKIQCTSFLISSGLIQKEADFFCKSSPEDAPFFIKPRCDEVTLDNKAQPSNEIRDSYVQAQKMRAAMTKIFSREYGLGSLEWHQTKDGMVGNPSISPEVANYMSGLHHQKVKAGCEATSARAVTLDIIGRLYDFNHRPENWALKQYNPVSRQDTTKLHEWGGGLTRRALHAIYTISFLCLLCIDEVLKIRRSHIEFEDHRIIITLPFRKTHQYGRVKPFHLHMLDEADAHLCPVRALADWINTTAITEGYIFRKIGSGEWPVAKDSAMVCFVAI
ncbi:hypothetical protein K443DRAFT_5035 [Laccaria amethystina LaAM-08-1]|uniref:Uncharacterized protein n=1 Tax=Laccaria amethystina LaAM-08-1 TaxID=1095629 RepID=A0A0C9Y1F5_9AGAR|nr:hypothetical protein K443DRAFT_5035 [Laccaria amethystina LaAM-08-1]